MNSPEKIHPENSPDHSNRAAQGGVSNRADATIHDRTGLYISIISLALAGTAMGSWLNLSQLIDAKVKAAVAQSEATAHAADVNSRIALDKVEDFRAKLAEKGINVTLDGH